MSATTFDFDLLVVGSGPGGQRAAIAAAKLGRKVGIIERRNCVGGVCVNTGTIPSKTLREAILHLSGYRLKSVYGLNYCVKDQITMEDLTLRTNHVMSTEMQVIESQMRRNGVTMFSGEARFADLHTMSVHCDREVLSLTADKFVLAPGTTPARPGYLTLVDEQIIDSDGILRLQRVPKTMTVVGAGIIGLEYASMFATLGVKITLIDARNELLDFVDSEIADALAYHLRAHGVTLRLGEEVVSVGMEQNCPVAHLASGKKIRNEVLLFSTGRQGRTASLNVEAIGLVPDDRGRLRVSSDYQTDVPSVYAVGDVVGFPALASTSMEQGRLAALHACGQPGHTMVDHYPYAVYTIPELSMVGRTERQLTEARIPFESGVAHYREIAKGQILGDETGLLKVLFHLDTHQVLGVHIIGDGASELVHIGQGVMAHGGTIEYFRDTVFNYPTLAECYKVAAYSGLNKI